MKAKILLLSFAIISLLESCNTTVIINLEPEITLQEQLQSFDLWYVDINSTQGNGEIPFLQKAFTVSFLNNGFYANNNLVGLGAEGAGFGLNVGVYTAFGNTLTVNHIIDGIYALEVYSVAFDEIEITDTFSNTTYRLIGYQRDEFDYDAVFYDNIEYFLQEYEVWNKIFTSDFGSINAFDQENYLRFIPDQINIFLSSQDKVGTDIEALIWDFEGDYEIFDIEGDSYLKILQLDYGIFGIETFELSVIDDKNIQLFHIDSGTMYRFKGKYNIQYLKGVAVNKERKRFKVKRKSKTI